MIACPLCGKAVRSSSKLDAHMVSHTKEKPHMCPICSATFGLPHGLKSHIKSVHEGVRVIKKRNSHCALCSYKCRSKTILKVHMRKHSTDVPFSCSVPNCGLRTKYEASLQQHFRAVHCDERPFECPSDGCSYKAKSKGSLGYHLRIHSSDKPFACQVPGCNYSSKFKSALKTHTFIHTDEKAFKCSTCDFRAKTRSALTQHQRRHLKIKPFPCQAPSCGFAGYSKEALERHFSAMHRKKDVLCTKFGCIFRCGSIQLLKRHLQVHEKPLLKCPAASCNYRTRLERCLLKHISRQHPAFESASVLGPGKCEPTTAGTAAEMGTLPYRFPKCGYQTKIPHRFNRHRVTYKDEDKGKHVCVHAYAVSNVELRLHAGKIHHIHVKSRRKGDEVRRCHACKLTFSSDSVFMLHAMTHLQAVVVLERLRVHVL